MTQTREEVAALFAALHTALEIGQAEACKLSSDDADSHLADAGYADALKLLRAAKVGYLRASACHALAEQRAGAVQDPEAGGPTPLNAGDEETPLSAIDAEGVARRFAGLEKRLDEQAARADEEAAKTSKVHEDLEDLRHACGVARISTGRGETGIFVGPADRNIMARLSGIETALAGPEADATPDPGETEGMPDRMRETLLMRGALPEELRKPPDTGGDELSGEIPKAVAGGYRHWRPEDAAAHLDGRLTTVERRADEAADNHATLTGQHTNLVSRVGRLEVKNARREADEAKSNKGVE